MKNYLKRFVCSVFVVMLLFSIAADPYVKAAGNNSTKSTKKNVTTTAIKMPEGAYNWKISLNNSIKGSAINKVKNYKVLVIDAQNYNAQEVKKLKDAGHIVLSYLNIGSVESNRKYYNRFKSLRLKTYENWEDEYWVNVSSRTWQNFVINNLVASMVKKGVDGFWVDNTDVYEYNKRGSIYKGLVKILTRLRKYNKTVILNGGDQFITPLIKQGKKHLIDGMVQEEVTTKISSYSGHGSFSNQSKEFQRYYERFFVTAKKANLSVGILEYTRSGSKKSSIKSYARKKKLNYCIASDLII